MKDKAITLVTWLVSLTIYASVLKYPAYMTGVAWAGQVIALAGTGLAAGFLVFNARAFIKHVLEKQNSGTPFELIVGVLGRLAIVSIFVIAQNTGLIVVASFLLFVEVIYQGLFFYARQEMNRI